MKAVNIKSIQSFKSRAISLAVLVGFLCLQFHSLSHINLSVLTANQEGHQTESIYTQIDEHSSDEQDIHAECPECILTKHIQADVYQGAILHLGHSSQIIAVSINEPVFETHYHTYQLRAPPFYAV